jgi:putative sterol carrier protein
LTRISVFESKVVLFHAGKLKPAGAYMTRKLIISGNMQKAMQLEKLMGMLKSKL